MKKHHDMTNVQKVSMLMYDIRLVINDMYIFNKVHFADYMDSEERIFLSCTEESVEKIRHALNAICKIKGYNSETSLKEVTE